MQSFGDAWLETRDGLRLLHTRGTPYESGLQHGVLLREDVRACFREVWRDGLMRGSPLFPRWLFYAYAWLNHGFMSRDERLELRGLADGSGLPYADVLVMNSQSPIDIGYNWVTGGCTQVVVPGRLVARNLDTLSLNRLHRYAVVQVHHERFLTPGFAGKVLDAVTGWNVHGLHVCQDDAQSAWTNPLGLYCGALVRRMVEHCA